MRLSKNNGNFSYQGSHFFDPNSLMYFDEPTDPPDLQQGGGQRNNSNDVTMSQRALNRMVGDARTSGRVAGANALIEALGFADEDALKTALGQVTDLQAQVDGHSQAIEDANKPLNDRITELETQVLGYRGTAIRTQLNTFFEGKIVKEALDDVINPFLNSEMPDGIEWDEENWTIKEDGLETYLEKLLESKPYLAQTEKPPSTPTFGGSSKTLEKKKTPQFDKSGISQEELLKQMRTKF